MFDDLKKLLESLQVSLDENNERPNISQPMELIGSLAFTLGVIRGRYKRGVLHGLLGNLIEWETVFSEQTANDDTSDR